MLCVIQNIHMSLSLKYTQKHIRFSPDPGAEAAIDIDCDEKFRPRITARVINESFGGCRVQASGHLPFCPGYRIRIRVGRLDPLLAEIRWVRLDPEGHVHLGIMYLDPASEPRRTRLHAVSTKP